MTTISINPRAGIQLKASIYRPVGEGSIEVWYLDVWSPRLRKTTEVDNGIVSVMQSVEDGSGMVEAEQCEESLLLKSEQRGRKVTMAL